MFQLLFFQGYLKRCYMVSTPFCVTILDLFSDFLFNFFGFGKNICSLLSTYVMGLRTDSLLFDTENQLLQVL